MPLRTPFVGAQGLPAYADNKGYIQSVCRLANQFSQLATPFVGDNRHLRVNDARLTWQVRRKMSFAKQQLSAFLFERDLRSSDTGNFQDQPIVKIIAQLHRKHIHVGPLGREY